MCDAIRAAMEHVEAVAGCPHCACHADAIRSHFVRALLTMQARTEDSEVDADRNMERAGDSVDVDTRPQVWERVPLWTLWDMQRFYADKAAVLIRLLGQLEATAKAEGASSAVIGRHIDGRPFIAKMREVQALCSECELDISATRAGELIDNFKHGGRYASELAAPMNELSRLIETEMRSMIFVRIQRDRVKYYAEDNLFGDAVSERLPTALRDIREAGTCYALGRYTACVFHLMRAMEVGLKALGADLGVPGHLPSWEAILKKIEAELAKPRADKTPEWLATEEFYRETANLFRGAKDAWRNHTMHATVFYDEDKAYEMIVGVKAILRHLAGKLALPEP